MCFASGITVSRIQHSCTSFFLEQYADPLSLRIKPEDPSGRRLTILYSYLLHPITHIQLALLLSVLLLSIYLILHSVQFISQLPRGSASQFMCFAFGITVSRIQHSWYPTFPGTVGQIPFHIGSKPEDPSGRRYTIPL